jgi:hypothetical protein
VTTLQQRIANPTRSPIIKRPLAQPASPVVVKAVEEVASPAPEPEVPTAAPGSAGGARAERFGIVRADLCVCERVLCQLARVAKPSQTLQPQAARERPNLSKGRRRQGQSARQRMKWALGRNEGLRDRGVVGSNHPGADGQSFQGVCRAVRD